MVSYGGGGAVLRAFGIGTLTNTMVVCGWFAIDWMRDFRCCSINIFLRRIISSFACLCSSRSAWAFHDA